MRHALRRFDEDDVEVVNEISRLYSKILKSDNEKHSAAFHTSITVKERLKWDKKRTGSAALDRCRKEEGGGRKGKGREKRWAYGLGPRSSFRLEALEGAN